MNNLKNTIYKYFDVLSFIILISIKILTYGKQMETGYFSYNLLFPPVFASILVLTAISFFFNIKRRARFLYLCNIIITLIIISDLTYFRYFEDVISLPVLINSFQLAAVKSSVSNLINPWDFIYAVDLILIVPKITKFKYENTLELKRKLKFSLFLLCICTGFAINFNNFYYLSKDQPKLLTTMYNKVYIVRKLGTLNYHYLDFYNSFCLSISKKTPVSKAKKSEIETFLQSNSNSTINFKGIAKGKNLIMIQVEALQDFVINNKIDGQDVTPNLNKMASKSSYFNNFYYQIADGGTSDAEFMTNNSLYPSPSGAAYFLYCGNEFNSMPKNFKDAGYQTAALHGFRESFWNRNVMYKKMGFDEFWGEKSFNIDETIGLGLSDESFLDQSVEKIKTLKEPYYAFLITLSSHFPFDYVHNYGDFQVGNFENTFLGNYLKSIHYTDAQLGIFLNKLEQEGILQNSIVVLYGDHSAVPKKNEKELAQFLNKDSFSSLDWTELQKVPLMIHFPNNELKGINSIPSGEMDVYPTICNLFNLPSKNLMGKDLFNSKNGKVIFRNGSFIYNNYYYMSENSTYYNMSTGEELKETEEMKNKKDSYLNELQYSDNILKHNLLKKFNNE